MILKYLIILSIFVTIPALAADGLGRLFYTPEQRAQLDLARARRDVRLPVSTEAAPIVQAPQPQGPNRVSYSGVVRRDDGKSTVWINGKPVNERNRIGTGNDVNILGMQNDGTVSLAVPHAARTASLKVGQSLDVSSGKIEESYARGGMSLGPSRRTLPAPAATQVTPLTALPAPRARRPLRDSDAQDAHPDGSAVAAPPDLVKQ